MRLTNIRKIDGKIVLKSGLHIGSGTLEMKIGGTDSPVVKHPHTQDPYIPGSSLKGKIRSLLEMESGFMAFTGGNPLAPGQLRNATDDAMRAKGEAILKLFGCGGGDMPEDFAMGPTRVCFNDCHLNEEWRRNAALKLWRLTEEKSENRINRINGTADPRFIERVPEGTEFDFLVTFKVLDGDEERKMETTLLRGMKLLELDALGGSGSRGYGRIAFLLSDPELAKRFESLNPF